MKSTLLLFAFVLCLLSGMNTASAEARVALVIGNSNYQLVPALANPQNDAAAVAAALERLGFDVMLGLDQSIDDMRDAIREFSLQTEGADLALFFYAGHGLQVAGKNYLLPVDANLKRERDLDFAAIDLQLVLDQLENGAKNSVVFLDACRDNPFDAVLTRSMGAARSSALGRGLAPVETLGGALIGLATSPGAVAYDGQGRHSPFTEALLTHIETPGLEINAMMTRVRADVVTATNQRQRPWTTTSLLDELYLAPEETPDKPDPVLEEVAAWRAAEASGTAADYEDYLLRFPEGLFADAATRALQFVTPPTQEQPAETEFAAVAPPPSGEKALPIQQETAPTTPLYGVPAVDAARFRAIPPGVFQMGSDSAAATPAERPVVSVAMQGFRVLASEVTLRDFRFFLESTDYVVPPGCFVWTEAGRLRRRDTANWENPGYPITEDMPVSCVSWQDAQAYVSWLNASGNKGFRLPSEAQFEYALRAGTTGDHPFEGGEAAACAHANAADASSRFRWRNTACDDGHPTVAAAKDLTPNAYGVTGLLGNLWEWTADCWNASHKGVTTGAPARQSGQCDSRVLRGGSWDDPFENLRSSYRVGIPANRRQANVGFRVVLDQ